MFSELFIVSTLYPVPLFCFQADNVFFLLVIVLRPANQNAVGRVDQFCVQYASSGQ